MIHFMLVFMQWWNGAGGPSPVNDDDLQSSDAVHRHRKRDNHGHDRVR